MTEGPLFKKILFFALPVLLSALLQRFYHTADIAVIGWFEDASALRLLLGATHLVALRPTLVEQSSSACLQASLQTRSAQMRPIISTWLLVK